MSIVLDTAWSCAQELDDYRTLTRQVVATLKPGDYLEIISGHPGSPKIRVAQFIQSGDTQEVKNIIALIKGLKCPIFSDVNISKSVDMALKRLIKSAEKTSFAHTALIVFTDGQLNDKDVKQLQQLSKEFKDRNWSLCITGTYSTNKKLLVAANQGKFKFSLIKEANPVLWIQSKREIKITESEPKQYPLIIDSQPPKESGKTGYSVTIDSSVSISEGSKETAEAPLTITLDDLQPETEELEKPIAPPIEEKIQEEPPEEIPEEEAKVKPIPQKKPWKIPKILKWLIPLILMFSFIAAVLARGISKTRLWKSKVSSHLNSTQQKTPGTLIAKVNGQTYHLGRIDKIRQIHIGSNPQNSIRIYDKAVAAQHLRIFRRFSSLWLKNLSSKTAFVNGVPLKPVRKVRMRLPCSIKIDDSITIKLQLQKPLIQNLSKQEVVHASKE